MPWNVKHIISRLGTYAFVVKLESNQVHLKINICVPSITCDLYTYMYYNIKFLYVSIIFWWKIFNWSPFTICGYIIAPYPLPLLLYTSEVRKAMGKRGVSKPYSKKFEHRGSLSTCYNIESYVTFIGTCLYTIKTNLIVDFKKESITVLVYIP